MEGGIGFGLGAILKSELTLDKGRVVQGNFDGYDVLQNAQAANMSRAPAQTTGSRSKP
jgi:isoquinoline 1-oxidoreductase subunit beta